RADGGRRRDAERNRHVAVQEDDADAHTVGATWAAAWWRCRRELVQHGLLASAVDHDRALVRALLNVREVAGRPADRRPRWRRALLRSSADTMLEVYLAAVGEAGGPAARREAGAIFAGHGLVPASARTGARARG